MNEYMLQPESRQIAICFMNVFYTLKHMLVLMLIACLLCFCAEEVSVTSSDCFLILASSINVIIDRLLLVVYVVTW